MLCNRMLLLWQHSLAVIHGYAGCRQGDWLLPKINRSSCPRVLDCNRIPSPAHTSLGTAHNVGAHVTANIPLTVNHPTCCGHNWCNRISALIFCSFPASDTITGVNHSPSPSFRILHVSDLQGFLKDIYTLLLLKGPFALGYIDFHNSVRSSCNWEFLSCFCPAPFYIADVPATCSHCTEARSWYYYSWQWR